MDSRRSTADGYPCLYMNLPANKYPRLRLTRIVVSVAVAIAVFVAVALGYDLWLSRWQIVPAVLAGSALWIILWVVVTAVWGRVYCSTACPLGTVMDIFAHFGRGRRGYFFSPSRTVVRRSITIIAVAALLMGIPVMFDLLDPASAFSRISAWSLGPIVRPVAFSLGAGIAAFATLAFVAAVSLARGRLICNTICPAGAALAEISKYSLYHIDINTDKCIGCGLCTERCKAECIDPSAHTVDPSRCVVCFDCTAACPNSAITYRRGRHRLAMPLMQTAGPAADSSSSAVSSPSEMEANPETHARTGRPMTRRDFFSALVASAPLAAFAAVDAPNPDLEPLNPVHPPGLTSLEALRLRCTACGACSAACPSGIIRPSGSLRALRSPLRPVLEFDTGSCRYDCVRCTLVCPTDALIPLTVSEKHLFVIGKARVVARFCIEYNEGRGCGICERRCPRRAIQIRPVEAPQASPGHPADRPELTPSGRPRRLPHVDPSLCIGCGECRYVCPARPRAFIIEGEA